MNTTQKTMRVLSIDAWSDGDGGWDWNSWSCVGEVPADTPTDKMVEAAFVAGIFSGPKLPDGYALRDDQYNMVIEDADGCPIYAFEYGAQF